MTNIAPKTPSPTKLIKPKRWLWALAIVALLLAWFAYRLTNSGAHPLGSLVHLNAQSSAPLGAQNAAQKAGYTIGDLGGQKVNIPPEYAYFMEYEGDPSVFEKQPNPKPKPIRTYDSKISSFGFPARYPDMAGVTKETRADYNADHISTSMWLRVGASSAHRYGSNGDNFLEIHGNVKKHIEDALKVHDQSYYFEKQTKKMYGLEVFVPKGVSDELMQGKLKMVTDNWYILRGKNNRIEVLINCSNVIYESAPCKASFYADKSKTHLTVSFRRGLLPEWRQIHTAVLNKISSFYITPIIK